MSHSIYMALLLNCERVSNDIFHKFISLVKFSAFLNILKDFAKIFLKLFF